MEGLDCLVLVLLKLSRRRRSGLVCRFLVSVLSLHAMVGGRPGYVMRSIQPAEREDCREASQDQFLGGSTHPNLCCLQILCSSAFPRALCPRPPLHPTELALFRSARGRSRSADVGGEISRPSLLFRYRNGGSLSNSE